jgi:hypothetical protein
MDTLRASSGGVIDDMTLQAEASKILSLHLATNAQDLGDLVGMGEKLGAAFGGDAKSGVDQFTQALASGRTGGLRAIGIDSDWVEVRVKQLKETGMSAADAFKQAAWEGGQKALANLGQSATVAEDGMAKLQTRIENIKQNLGQAVNTTIDAAATSADQLIQSVQILTDTHPLQVAAEAPAKAFAESYATLVGKYTAIALGESGDSFVGHTLAKFVTESEKDDMVKVYEALKNDPTLLQNRQSLYDTLTDMPHESKDAFINATAAAMQQQGVNLVDAQMKAYSAEESKKAGAAHAMAYMQSFIGTFGGMKDAVVGVADDFNSVFNPTPDQIWAQKQQEIAGATESLNQFIDSYGNMGSVTDISNQPGINLLGARLDAAKQSVVEFQDMASKGLIADADVTRAQDIVTSIQQAKDKIDAIQKMGLSGLLGTDKADAAGSEITTQVMEELKKSGKLTDQQLAGYQTAFGQSDGSVTESSKKLNDQMIPILASIAETSGPEIAALAKKNVEEYLKQAKLEGLSDDQTAAGMDYATGVYKPPVDKHALNNGTNNHDYVALPRFRRLPIRSKPNE